MTLMKRDVSAAAVPDTPRMVAMVEHGLRAETPRERFIADAYARLYPSLLRSARKLVGDEDAEDAVHDAFSWYVKAFDTLPPDRRGDKLLRKGLRSAGLNILRSAKRREKREVSDDESAFQVPVVTRAAGMGDAEALWSIVDQLPERCRVTWVLVRLMDATREEAADEMGVTLETVKSQLRRASLLIAAAIENAGLTLASAREMLALGAGPEGTSNV